MPTKLAELRSRTDRDLAVYLHRRLDFGFRAVGVPCREHAAAACDEAALLLPLIYGLEEGERRRLEVQLSTLRGLLETGCRKAS